MLARLEHQTHWAAVARLDWRTHFLQVQNQLWTWAVLEFSNGHSTQYSTQYSKHGPTDCMFIISHSKSQPVLVCDLPVGVAASGVLIVQVSPLRKLQAWSQSSIKFWWKLLVKNRMASPGKYCWSYARHSHQSNLARCSPSLRVGSRSGRLIKDWNRSTYVRLCLWCSVVWLHGNIQTFIMISVTSGRPDHTPWRTFSWARYPCSSRSEVPARGSCAGSTSPASQGAERQQSDSLSSLPGVQLVIKHSYHRSC